MEIPNRSSDSATNRVATVTGLHEKTDDALDGLFATKKRKVTKDDHNTASTSTPPLERSASKTDTKVREPLPLFHNADHFRWKLSRFQWLTRQKQGGERQKRKQKRTRSGKQTKNGKRNSR